LTRNKFITCLTFIALVLLGATLAYAEEGNETSEEYSFKMAVERHLESKLNTVLREVTGIRRLVAIVKVEVEAQQKPSEDTRVDKEDINVLFLPGVPARTGSTYFADGAVRPPVMVKKLDVKVLVDSDVSRELTTLAHNVAISLVGYNPDRGDTLVIEKFEFMSGGSGVGSILSPPNVYFLLLSLPFIAFLVAASIFFMNPYRKLKESLNEAGLGLQPSTSGMRESASPIPAPILEPLAGTRQRLAEAAAESSSGTEETAFGYLRRHRSRDILFALGDLEPEEISVVLNYMDPALAAETLGRLDESVRAASIENLVIARQLDRDSVNSMEEKLRIKLAFMTGGDDKLASILENTDDILRDSLMDTIEKHDTEAASRIGRKIRTFESVIRRAKPMSIDSIVRHFGPSSFARILTSAPGDVQGRVLDSLGKGASELLREEMRFATPLEGIRLRNEKRRVVEEFRAMSDAGLIDEPIEEDS